MMNDPDASSPPTSIIGTSSVPRNEEEGNRGDCEESVFPSTTAQDDRGTIRETEEEKEVTKVGAIPSKLPPPQRGLLKNNTAKDGGQQQQQYRQKQKPPPSATIEKQQQQQQQDLDVMDIVRKRAIMANEDIGINTEVQKQAPIQPPMANRLPMDSHQHQQQPHQKNCSPANINHELLQQENRQSTMDAVRNRAIMEIEEMKLNKREMMAPQSPTELIPRQDPVPRTMHLHQGAFAGAPGVSFHRRDDIRFSLVGIDLPGEEITNDDTTLGAIEDGGLSPIEPALQMSIIAGNNSATETSGDRLAEALPVEDDELPATEAKPYDVEAAAKRKSKQATEQKSCFLVLGLVIIFILGVIVGFVYRRETKKKELEGNLPPTITPISAPTESPSSAPTGSLDWLREGLPEYTKASLEIFDSPQWKAWDWLMNHPKISRLEEWRKRQLFSLATFYYSMDGDNWFEPVRDRWMDYGKGECGWHSSEFGYFYDNWGVYEYRQFERGFIGVPPCNKYDEFQSIFLETRESFLAPPLLNPFIPPEIALLTSLSTIALDWNYLNTSINDFFPSQVYRMTDMKHLWMMENLLTGHIPSELGLITNMELLGLQRNSLTGQIPSQLGLMIRIAGISLFSNSFTGQIPTVLGLMTGNKILELGANLLTGPIPSELAKMSDMWKLLLHDNNLTGTVPRELEYLALNGSLRSLSLHNNALSGTIPEGLCSLGVWDDRASPIMGDFLNGSFRLGLSFDCNERLCGCCWCPCPGSNYSATEKCETDQDNKFREDKDWPGAFPTPLNDTNFITVNIRSDAFPIQTTFEWSILDEESGLWNVTHSEGLPAEGKEMVHSYTMPIESDALYRLQLHDYFGDGTCCWFGLGWFTITSSIQSQDYANGTVVWEATGFDLQFVLDVFIWVDSNGLAHQVEYLPDQGYSLVQEDGGSTASEQDHQANVVLPDIARNNGTSFAGDEETSLNDKVVNDSDFAMQHHGVEEQP